jgi:phage shock protein A
MSEEMDEQGYYPIQITEPIKKGKKQLEQELEIATKMIGQLRAEMVSMRLQVSNYKKYISELKNKDNVQEQQD